MESRMYITGKVIRLSLLFFIVFGLNSCEMPNRHCGFSLSEFVIDDDRLQSIVDSMTTQKLSSRLSDEGKKVISLDLSKKDSLLLFIFSLREKEELISKYIYRYNKRIVGFANSNNMSVILLSDIDDLAEFGNCYGRFIHPTGAFKTFDYMVFPEKLYVGEGANTWPFYELIYSPTYIVYPYVDNKFLSPIISTNPDWEL